MKFILIALVLMATGACMQKYQPPLHSENTAKIRLIAVTKNMNVFHIEENNCRNRILIGTLKNAFIGSSQEKSSIGMIWESGLESRPSPKNFREIVIPAGREFHLFYIALANNLSHNVNVTFLPEPNKNYEFILSGYNVIAKELIEQGDKVTSIRVRTSKPEKQCY